ncbi:hypothetical protein [Nonomuraea sp. NPDC049695]|uniref:hypothetical protein n=1 Tax=Nonomuraea sp. NPDC049695 TaxID=3154734 RepID=UPI00343006CF
MSNLIKRIDGSVTVETRNFMIMDDDGATNRPDDAISMDELVVQLNTSDEWFATTANLALIESGDTWHVADVALEWWDDEPPADNEAWTKSHTATMYSSSGKLRLVQTLGSQSRRALDLKEKAITWSVRASVRPGPGRRKVSGKPPRGIESYRFQFWRSVT